MSFLIGYVKSLKKCIVIVYIDICAWQTRFVTAACVAFVDF